MIRRALLIACLAPLAALAPAAAAAAPAEQRIEVRATTAAGAPLAGVAVVVSTPDGASVVAEATTSDDGLAVFALPAAAATYRLAARHAAHLESASTIELKRPRRSAPPVAITVVLQPKGAAEHFNDAVTALRAGEAAAAEASLRAAVGADPGFARGWTVLAKLALDARRPEEALEHAARALESDASELPARELRYEALSALGRTEEAEAALSELFERDPSAELARLLFNSGAEAANRGELPRARLRLAQAAERDPALWQAHSALAEVAIREQSYDAAVAELDRALAIAPSETRLVRRKIEVLRAAGRADEAAALEAALAAPPGG